MRFTRITVDAGQMGGVPCIRGLRIPVAVIAMVADGMTEQEILAACPDLEREDLHEALRHAAEAVRERELPRTSPRASRPINWSPIGGGPRSRHCAAAEPMKQSSPDR